MEIGVGRRVVKNNKTEPGRVSQFSMKIAFYANKMAFYAKTRNSFSGAPGQHNAIPAELIRSTQHLWFFQIKGCFSKNLTKKTKPLFHPEKINLPV